MWEQDECDFGTVTLGLGHLHLVLHAFRGGFGPERPRRDPRRKALLAAAPGEQHTFGLAMVGEFLRRAGWEVQDACGCSRPELAALVRGDWFAIAALTASEALRLPGLGETVHALRRASRNRGLGVLVGGRVFEARPDRVALVGADAAASDAAASDAGQSVRQAERLWVAALAPARLG